MSDESTKEIIKKKVKPHIPKDWLKELRIVYRIGLETIYGIKRTGWINIAIITTMAAILTIFGSLFRTTLSITSFVQELGNVLEISVYLKESANTDSLAKEIRGIEHVERVKIIPKDVSWANLRREMSLPDISNPLPDTLHVKVDKPENITTVFNNIKDLKSFRQLKNRTEVTNWLQVNGLNDADTVSLLVKEFGFHNLDAKDILTPQHIVKIEFYDNRYIIILNICYYDENEELKVEHIGILVAENNLITFCESNRPIFENVEKAIKENLLNIRVGGCGQLLAHILNIVTSYLVEASTHTEDLLEDIEAQLLELEQNSPKIGLMIQQRRRDYITLRKNSLPLKEQFQKMNRADNVFNSAELKPIYNDLYDQLLFVIQTVESCREMVSSLMDLYIANNDLKMNTIMKRLTVVSTIFIPLTFLVGVWGMNFEMMPELKWKYGYFMAWSIMFVAAVLSWLYLRKLMK